MVNYQKRVFYITVLIDFSFGLFILLRYRFLLAIIGVILGLFSSSCIYFIEKIQFNNWRIKELIRFLLFASLSVHIVAYYRTGSSICYISKKYDEYFVKGDTFFLGWLFPRGQMAIWLDQNQYLNPQTYLGIRLNSLMIIFYSLYFPVHLMVLFPLLFYICKDVFYRLKNNGKFPSTYNTNLNNLYFCYTGFVLTYCSVIFINLMFPAWSPRIYLKYKTKMKYIPFFAFLDVCKNDSANSFPSGHVAETLVHFLCLNIIGFKRLKWVIFIIAIFIFPSTLILRKHYFVDILLGAFISFFAFFIPYRLGYLKNKKNELISSSNDNNPNKETKDKNSDSNLNVKDKKDNNNTKNINDITQTKNNMQTTTLVGLSEVQPNMVTINNIINDKI